ncbi:YaaR family protein [Treponema sp.]|uniref:YaaR family protein n=1 Tax=Treponema sp. TaxID=166 RepID=UPI0025FDABB8|nr:YaaR family protein [Treponema sp.]MCR5217272.1 YaaR family protein [Treponema sp.]
MQIDSTGLFFSAANSAAMAGAQVSKEQKSSKIKKKSFASALEKSAYESELIQEGFPIEIAEMETEEAAVYLRDEAEKAADALRQSQMPDKFADFRKKVSVFMRYIEKNNFEVKVKQRKGFNSKGQPLPPRVQIKIINKDLDEMAAYFLSSQKDTLKMLAKLNEISGLLVDLLAS